MQLPGHSREETGGWYQADSWWQSRDGLRETWVEYLKLLLHLV